MTARGGRTIRLCAALLAWGLLLLIQTTPGFAQTVRPRSAPGKATGEPSGPSAEPREEPGEGVAARFGLLGDPLLVRGRLELRLALAEGLLLEGLWTGIGPRPRCHGLTVRPMSAARDATFAGSRSRR